MFLRRRSVFVLVLAVAGCSGSSADEAPATTSDTGSVANDTGTVVDDTGTVTNEDTATPTDSTVTDTSTTSDATGPMPMGCIAEIAAGTKVFSCDGLDYDVTVPAACVAGGCGLVLDVHGMTMSGKMEDNNTNMRALGEKHGYVVVQPNANPDPPSSAWKPDTDDAKVKALLTLAIAAYKIDPDRVHMTGFSQGGMMSSRFLCKYADLFASIAPAAGTGCTFKGTDMPSREVPVLYIHGKTDALVAFSQGTAQRDAAYAAWKLGSETVVSSDAKHKWTRRTSPSGTVFEFIEHTYEASSFVLKGHCYPGSKDLKSTEPGQLFGFACTDTGTLVWGEVVMKFFRDHPRKK